MGRFTDADVLVGAVFTLIRQGQQQECLTLLQECSPSELHELRDVIGQFRSLTIDASRKGTGS